MLSKQTDHQISSLTKWQHRQAVLKIRYKAQIGFVQCEQSLCDFSLLLDMFVMWVTYLSKNERQRKDISWVLLNDFGSQRKAVWSRPNKRVRSAVKKSKTCGTRARSTITTCAHKPTHVQPDNLTATVMTSLSHLSLPSVFPSLSISLYNSPAPFPFITVQISLLAIQSSHCHLWHLGSYFSRRIFPALLSTTMKGVTAYSTTGACSDKVVRDGALIYNLCLFHVFICALLLFSQTLPSHRDKELSCCCGGQQVRTESERYHKVVNTRWGRQGHTSWITPESPRSCPRRTKEQQGQGRSSQTLGFPPSSNLREYQMVRSLEMLAVLSLTTITPTLIMRL